MEKKLYKWQEECLNRWQQSGCRGMVQAVTGSGKTLLALTAADRLLKNVDPDLKVKIVVPTGALMQQWNRAVREFLSESRKRREGSQVSSFTEQIDGTGSSTEHMSGTGSFTEHASGTGNRRVRIGLRGGGYKDPADRQYMIYVINSARYELARQILAELKQGESIFLIADECHHYDSGENSLIFEFLPFIEPYRERYFTLGLSATLPSGRSRQTLTAALGRRIYSYGMEEASRFGTVCRYDVFHIRLSFQGDERAEYEELSDKMTHLYGTLVKAHPMLKKMDIKQQFELLRNLCGSKDKKIADAASGYLKLSYKRKSLVCLAADRIACAWDLVQRLDEQEKILIFGERIRQAEKLYKLLQEQYPGRVGRYHSEMGAQANKNALERFRTGQIRILIACKAMDEGVDVPDASIGIILSGTATRRQRIQRLGRILRLNEGKDRASLYYLHIEETSEDVCFLPDGRENTMIELEYDSDWRRFFQPDYDEAATKVLDHMEKAGASEEQIKEAEHCLNLGIVRADWKRGTDYVKERIRTAASTRERNYWVCMERLRLSINREGNK